MKFRDIKRFTGDGHYKCNVPLHSIKRTIDDYIEMGLDLDPDFQRGHVWTDEDRVAFLEYFLRGGATGRILYFNCIGWNSFERGSFVIVDGKQRLTSVLMFLNNEIKVFGHYYKEYEDKPSLSDDTFVFCVNELATRKEVLEWYLQMNSCGVAHTTEELDKVKKLLESE